MSTAAPATGRRRPKPDPQQAKVRREKQILAVGSVILLALLGYQLPKLLGGGGEETAATAPSTVASGTAGPAPAGGRATLPDTDRVVIQPGSGQLVSFGLFKSKDPFVQQLSAVAATSVPAPSATPAPTAPATTTTAGRSTITPATSTTPSSVVPFPSTTPAATTPVSTPPPSTTTPSTPPATSPATTTPAAPATAPGNAAISTNGACEVVPLKGTFPGSEDIFRVTSIATNGKSVKIAVVGGSYDGGQGTVTLAKGKKLTLVNTADGTRYVLLLKDSCDVETAPVAAGTTTSASRPSTPATTTAPTTTEPIVEDALDSGEAETTVTG